MTTINREGWLAAVALVQPVDDPDAFTAAELCDMFGCKQTATKDRIKKLLAAGLATLTQKRIRDSAGRSQTIAAYRLVQQEPAHDGRTHHRVERRTRRA